MKNWFLENHSRSADERAAIDRLAASAEWLVGHAWRLDKTSGQLVLDAEIEAHGATYALVMYYPPTYPGTPPYIKSNDPNERLSDHQYADGTLCLQWGPDTWTPHLTGAHLLESAHKLLQAENPRGAGGPQGSVSSRHQLTMGQQVRGEERRLWVEPSLLAFFANLPEGAVGHVKSTVTLGGDATVALLQSVSVVNGPAWTSSAVPARLSERTMSWVQQGVFLKTGVGSLVHGSFSKTADLEVLLRLALPGAAIGVKEGNYGIAADFKPTLLLLVNPDGHLHIYRPKGHEADLLDHFVEVTDGKDGVVRTPDAASLSSKKVAIVGLGSVGSKMAVSLARSGVRHFTLVDDDILLPGNLVRHACDWMDVGQHKANAVRDAVERICQNANVRIFRSNLTAQESNAHLNRVLTALGECDLIIDATAVPGVSNTLSAVADTYAKPVVWCEVFAGGIGGLVARSRPGLDPTSQEMRAQFQMYTAQLPVMEAQAAKDYSAVGEDGTVFVASDADVSVIVAHATRFALDTLLRSTDSMFPVSMYLIGLAKGWIFTAPFETIPLDVGSPVKIPAPEVSPETVQHNLDFIRSLLAA